MILDEIDRFFLSSIPLYKYQSTIMNYLNVNH